MIEEIKELLKKIDMNVDSETRRLTVQIDYAIKGNQTLRKISANLNKTKNKRIIT